MQNSIHVSVSSMYPRNNRSLFDEIGNVEKELLFVFSPSRLFLACQSDEVGKMKLEQKTKLKLKT